MMRPGIDGPSINLCVEPVDFRKSISGLSLIVEQSQELNPFEPVLYVFVNRKRDRLKILYWERNGFCLWYKKKTMGQSYFMMLISTSTRLARKISKFFNRIDPLYFQSY